MGGIRVVVCGNVYGKIENSHRPLKTFACVSPRYRKHCGGGGIVVVVCAKVCGKTKSLAFLILTKREPPGVGGGVKKTLGHLILDQGHWPLQF